MNRFKKPLLFSLAILPISVIAVVIVCLYQFTLYDEEIFAEAVSQLGSKTVLVVVTTVQSVGLFFACSFFGYILAEKTGLWQPLTLDKKKTIRTLLFSAGLGILLSLDYWLFGSWIDGIKEATAAGMTFYGVSSSILYGGILEEILLRLFVLSLLVWILHKLLYRKKTNAPIPSGIYIAANCIAAFLFAAAHLPATLITFGGLTPLLLFRCFLFNGGFGLAFGAFYRRYGLVYAMLSHMTVHLVSILIWFLFI